VDEYREANRALWNAWTQINLRSEMYDVEAFAAGRGRDLDPIARAGPGDVRGKSLLHLQCHFGMDTIPFLAWRFFPWMERGADGWWRLPEDPRLPLGRGSLPLMFSLKAVGPA